ncbi:hypothetical protein [Streptomyces sp. NBC_00887]|uniref:hypothetical protein n=1 Tax=Streptomyces sp. NBC_00887 TaxID=2975859 RepID=UPI003865CE95|nr:hypothetical protein OG844_20205 [Streptomyces sp. NBC_00887]
MTQPTTPAARAEAAPDGPNRLWVIAAVSFVVFLATWGLSWIKAYAINDDLPNACGDVRRQAFPPEVTCVSGSGAVTGANAGGIEILFYASFGVAVMFGTLALAVTVAVRGK